MYMRPQAARRVGGRACPGMYAYLGICACLGMRSAGRRNGRNGLVRAGLGALCECASAASAALVPGVRCGRCCVSSRFFWLSEFACGALVWAVAGFFIRGRSIAKAKFDFAKMEAALWKSLRLPETLGADIFGAKGAQLSRLGSGGGIEFFAFFSFSAFGRVRWALKFSEGLCLRCGLNGKVCSARKNARNLASFF